jgi:hypothetical protein
MHLHRLAEQSGLLYARQTARFMVKRQRQVEMLGRRLENCAHKLRAGIIERQSEPGGAAAAAASVEPEP